MVSFRMRGRDISLPARLMAPGVPSPMGCCPLPLPLDAEGEVLLEWPGRRAATWAGRGT